MASKASKKRDTLDRDRVMGAAEAAAFCGFSLPHFRVLYRTGKVPLPFRIGERKLAWRAGTLADWLKQKSEVNFDGV